jgi:tagaturonate reductase
MKTVNQTVEKKSRPVKVLQIGEGVLLRGFIDFMIDVANEKGLFDGSVQVVKPRAGGSLKALKEQDCIYTIMLRGKKDGLVHVEKRIITSIADAVHPYDEYEKYAAFAKSPDLRFFISNTTEAGIFYDDSDKYSLTPPNSFPGKLTKFLYERFKHFKGTMDKGLYIIPTELIENNGDRLLDCCKKLAKLWDLGDEFASWLEGANTFCNTLVDRIVTGYPKDEIDEIQKDIGYIDTQFAIGEPFGLWVIECPSFEALAKEFPLDKAGEPTIFTDDHVPYRERKIRVLNGAHTASVLAAYLSGKDIVLDMMKDDTLRAFFNKAVYDEIVPMVPLPESEAKEFADSVVERFENPFIKHNLLAISVNSTLKFKTRILPTIKDYYAKKNSLPPYLCFSLAALMAFFSGEKVDGKLVGKRDGVSYDLDDDPAVLEFFELNGGKDAKEFVTAYLCREDFWGEDLTKIPGFVDAVAGALQNIRDNGMRKAVEKIVK